MIQTYQRIFCPLLVCILLLFSAPETKAQYWPCQGTVSFSEDFESGLPAGWQVWDMDSLNPSPQIPLVAGWQADTDFTDTTNIAMYSPSWYLPGGASDDWLVSPQISLPSNPCLSWQMWSVDAFYPEAMEILISTTTADTAGFHANPLIVAAVSIAGPKKYYAVNLGAYGGQNVYLAFRQTSSNKYILGFDEVKITAVDSLDAAIVSMDSIQTLAFAPTDVKGLLANLGSDTLKYAEIYYSVDGGSVSDTLILDSIALGQNQTLSFTHPQKWIPDTTRLFTVCGFLSSPNHVQPDENISNDTSCIGVNVVNAVGVDAEAVNEDLISVWPNPFQDKIMLETELGKSGTLELFSASGQMLRAEQLQTGKTEWDTQSLSPGIYLLRFSAQGGQVSHRKIIRY